MAAVKKTHDHLTHEDFEAIGDMVATEVDRQIAPVHQKLDSFMGTMPRGLLIAGGLPIPEALEREPEA